MSTLILILETMVGLPLFHTIVDKFLSLDCSTEGIGGGIMFTERFTNTNMSKCVLILFVFLIEKTADIKSNKYRIN